jgi:hypothetical protein
MMIMFLSFLKRIAEVYTVDQIDFFRNQYGPVLTSPREIV